MPATTTAPCKEAGRRGPVFSLRCALVIALGLAVSTFTLIGGIMLLATRNSMAPERALNLAGVLATLISATAGALAARWFRRLGFFENAVTGLIYVGTMLATLGRNLAGTDTRFLSAAYADIAYLANLFGTSLGGPIGGVGVAAGGLWLASFIGCTLGFLLAGDGKADLNFGYEFFIAKNHLRLRKRSATMLMTFISVCGVAVGVLALTVVLSVMGGFEIDLKGKIVGANAHAVVMRYGRDFTEWRETAETVRKVKGVQGVTPFILNEVMVSSDQNLGGCLLKGIDPATTNDVGDLEKNLTEGKVGYLAHPEKIPPRQRMAFVQDFPEDDLEGAFDEMMDRDAKDAREKAEAEVAATDSGSDGPQGDGDELTIDDILQPQAPGEDDVKDVLPGIILGKELASALKARTGDRINVVSPLGEESGPAGRMPKSRPFRVAGIFYSGMYEFDSKSAYISIPEAQKFFGMGDSVTGLELKTDDIDNTRQITRSVLSALGGYPYRTKDFAEMNKNLFSALRLERLVMAVILGFIVLVACFNIVSTLIMMVLEKGKDIAILKSMGASDTSVMKIFVIEGLIIGAIGTAAGTVLGYATCLFVEKFGITLDSDVYYIDRLPVEIDPSQFLGVALLALVLSYLATIYPATRASRLAPVDGLRND